MRFPVNILLNTILLQALFIIYSSCNNNPYENKLGIKPSVIAQIDTANYTSIEWIDSVKNFETINSGDTVLVKYRFRNTGKKPLFLTEVQPSCGCTVIEYPKDLILPGNEGLLIARFDSKNKSGYIHKTILVITNTSNRTNHQLVLYGQVNKK